MTTRTLDPAKLAETREMIFGELRFARLFGDDGRPKPPDEIFHLDSVAAVDEAQELVDTIKFVAGDNVAEIQYVLALAAATTLIELLEFLRDTGGVE